MGMQVSRNPFAWVGMWLYGIVLIPFTILIYPLFLVLLWFGFVNNGRKGNYAEILEEGIKVINRNREFISLHHWNEIKEVTMEFEPPCFYPALHLLGGEVIHLHCANLREINTVCKDNGIKVIEKHVENNT